MKASEIRRFFFEDERGLETVEYAIILGLIVVGTISLVAAIGLWVHTRFNTVNTTLQANP